MLKHEQITERISDIDLKLEPLRKQCGILERKILKLCKSRTKLVEEKDSLLIKSFPGDAHDFTKEQWFWLLERGRQDSSSVRYEFCNRVLSQLGFGGFGYLSETNQPSLSISDYSKVKEGFKIIKKYLKPVTVEGFQSTETGLRFEVHGIDENTTSILYVHKKDDAVLYITKYSGTKEFKNFDAFVDWYVERFN